MELEIILNVENLKKNILKRYIYSFKIYDIFYIKICFYIKKKRKEN